MHWLQTLDTDLFRFLNQSLANPVLDIIMPLASGNALFLPVALVAGGLLLWKGGPRGRLLVLMLILVVAVTDGLICNTIKHAVARERPFLALPDVRCLVGQGGSGSMPSSHAANWFAAMLVALVYYRGSVWFMLPAACVVSFSRIYNGVHYPSDVLAGAILGAGSAAVVLWTANELWRHVGQRWFPLWWAYLPSLLVPVVACPPSETGEPVLARERTGTLAQTPPGAPTALPAKKGIAPAGFRPPHVTLDEHWLRLGYLVIALLLIVRWVYIGGKTIQLAEDEAYQWLWSKHLALSYYSKPPLIAYTQFLGTSLWGDTAFGVRFFSPLIAATLSVLVLRFFAREVNARAGFFLVLIVSATPLISTGSVLMTVDPLLVLFWTLAMLSGWRAVQDRGTTRDWLLTGLWMGLAFLSKPAQLFQLIGWATFFALWPPARKHLRRPGPYLALLVNFLGALPVLVWNAQHQWVTVGHIADNAAAHQPWRPTLRFVLEFLGAEAGLLNPIFFVAMLWAAVGFWRRGRHNPLLIFCFSMGAPVLLIYFLHSFKARIMPNWVAPAVVPMFCLMVIYWEARWRFGEKAVGQWLRTGLVVGAVMVVLAHNTNLVAKITRVQLPPHLDHLHRVREWDTTARVVNEARLELLKEGKPVFIITDHYGLAGEISFYLPEARSNVTGRPLVYARSSAEPQNQFYFWPGYGERKGENAIFVRELNRKHPVPEPPPERLVGEFDSVTSLGVSNVLYRGQYLLRPLQLFACRGVK